MRLLNVLLVTLIATWIMSCRTGELVTKSGYEYRFVSRGDGKAVSPEDFVFFTIKISGDDGTVLQEMGEGPQMPRIQIPKTHGTGKDANPVAEVLSVCKIGDHVIMTMPIDSLPSVPPDVQNMKFIEYEMVVKDVKSQEEYDKFIEQEEKERQERIAISRERIPAIQELVKATINDYKSGKLEVTKTDSGLKYYITKNGEGDNIQSGNTASVQYYGSLMNGEMFDNSFMRGDAFPVPVGKGQVIKGWDEGLTYFNKGAKGFLFIPAELGYGEAGSPPMIPGNSELVFYIEIDDIKK
ncbi:MAG: FKBP-type peptidyl-prolyl cis-trans isomerase [Saprospiraceae bacterium]|nr:FKBP-type peptidyl-prolyl cis-trans isomerase [Saprospiraceae bacterium]